MNQMITSSNTFLNQTVKYLNEDTIDHSEGCGQTLNTFRHVHISSHNPFFLLMRMCLKSIHLFDNRLRDDTFHTKSVPDSERQNVRLLFHW